MNAEVFERVVAKCQPNTKPENLDVQATKIHLVFQ